MWKLCAVALLLHVLLVPALGLTVSVVIPALCRNLQKTFLVTALSIAHQIERPDEVVVVASGCETAEAEGLRQLYANILAPIPLVLFDVEHIQHEAISRNAGADLSSGDIIMFIDADDFMVPEYVQAIMGIFKKTGAHMVLHGYSGRHVLCADRRPKISRDSAALHEIEIKTRSRQKHLTLDIHHAQGSFKREVTQWVRYKSVGGEDSVYVRAAVVELHKRKLEFVYTTAKLSVYTPSKRQKQPGFLLKHLFLLFKYLQAPCNPP